MQIIQCGSIFISFFSPLSVKKASKARKDLQSIHEGNGAMLLPHSARTHPPFSLYLRCRVDLSPSSAACSPCTVMYSPPLDPPELHFRSVFVIYIRVCFYCLMRAGTHLVLSEGVLFMQLWLFVFLPNVRRQRRTFVVFPLFPFVSLLYVFALGLNAWMASPSLVPLVFCC